MRLRFLEGSGVSYLRSGLCARDLPGSSSRLLLTFLLLRHRVHRRGRVPSIDCRRDICVVEAVIHEIVSPHHESSADDD